MPEHLMYHLIFKDGHVLLSDGQPLSEEEAVVLISALERYVYHLPCKDAANGFAVDGATAAHNSFIQWATDTCIRNVDRYEVLGNERKQRIQDLQIWRTHSGLMEFELHYKKTTRPIPKNRSCC